MHVSENVPASHHDGGDHDGAVLHAGGVVWEERRVLDQHQFVCVVPVADLQGGTRRAAGCGFVCSYFLGGEKKE